jgi:hypothetical protein
MAGAQWAEIVGKGKTYQFLMLNLSVNVSF